MRNRYMTLLFISQCIPPIVGMGLFPVLPLYAARFGATHTMIGLYFATMSVASLLAAVAASWLGGRFGARRVFVGVSALGVPALALLGQARTFWAVVLLTAAIWFIGGVVINLISVLAGMSVHHDRRGRAFALLFLSYPLGAILGGTIIGQLVAYRGYAFMFATLGGIWLALPLIGLLGLDGRTIGGTSAPSGATPSMRRGLSYALLLAAALLASVAINISRLSTSLVMETSAFSASAIASTGVVAGLAAIPVLLVLGRVSDRLGHWRLLLVSGTLTVAGAVLLSAASQLWQFQLAAALLLVAWCTRGAATSALTTALLPAAELSVALPQVTAMENLAGILGFGGAGWLLDAIAAPGMVVLVALLTLSTLQIVALLARRMERTPNTATLAVRGTGPALVPLEATQG